MTTGIIIFLSVAVAALAAVLTIVTMRQFEAVEEYEAADSKIAVLIAEKDALLVDKLECGAKMDESEVN